MPDEYAGYTTSKVVILPVPYDETSTWQKGADKGPEAFLEASENMELYDIETDSEVYQQGVFLAESVVEKSSPEEMIEAVYQATKKQLNNNKMVRVIGGEHSVTIGAIRAYNEKFENLTVLQLDAHADLRKEYEGSTCNHACALYEASQTTNLIQLGIRSMDSSEKAVMKKEQVFFAHNFRADQHWQEKAVNLMTNNVYITIDLDAFDPAIAPATGTPKPGGLYWNETLQFLKKVFQEKNVVGFDIEELCPNEIEKSSDFLMAKLYYKLLSYKYALH